MHPACYRNRYQAKPAVKAVIVASSVNESATDGTTPLYLAAQDGNFDCLKFLHGVGAKCNITSRDGMHPIHAAAQNGHLDCLGYLAIHGRVSMTERDRTGATPAHYAAGQGHLSVLKWLNVRCDVKIKDSLGGTPLHDAAEKGQLHCLRFLVEVVHLDVRSKDSSNTSPIDLAERYGHVTCHEYMKTAHAKNLKQKAERVKEYTPFDTWTVDSASAGASFLHVLKRTPSKASLVPPPPATAKAPSIAPLSCSPCPTPKPPRTSNSVLNVPIARFEFVPLADTNTVLSEPTTRSDSVPSADEHNKPEPSSPKVISEVSMQNAVNVKKFQIESKINDDVLDAARKRTMFLKRSTEVYSGSDTSSPVTSPSDKLDSRRGSVEFKNAITSARSNLKSSLSRNSSKSEDNLYKIEDEELNITERKVSSSENMDGNPVEKKENVVSVETKKATNENAIQDVASEKFFTEQEDRFQESESTSYSDKPFMIENTAREQIFKQQLESKVAPSNGTHPNGGSPVSPLSSITTQMLKRPLRERQMVAMPHMGESAEDNDGVDEDTWLVLQVWIKYMACIVAGVDEDTLLVLQVWMRIHGLYCRCGWGYMACIVGVDEDTWLVLCGCGYITCIVGVDEDTWLVLQKEEEHMKYGSQPKWKIPLLERQESDRLKEEQRFAGMPEWKKALIQKREHQTK
ncbi:predicted protein [Nematostella vectensis]|uniref:Espin n=1 Tax=Nematostella vectensis TaxID=45351 RepID=A7SNB2_NEMVE|nr:predicted protein [Nematostella vectensis]|eukprot:XP_001626923.1 predicted protein [Nematostella vectensis]